MPAVLITAAQRACSRLRVSSKACGVPGAGSRPAATNEILDCVETVEKVAAALAPEQAEALRQATTRIYEACSFQDITGQRVTKVVATLKSIDARVHAIIATFGDAGGQPQRRSANDTAAPEGDTRLLNGPQLPGNGVDQASIDALFD